MVKRILVILLFLSFLILLGLFGGCHFSSLEKTAYQTVTGSKAFLDSVKKAHPECTQVSNPVPRICSLLVQATAAKDLLIDAGETYCGGGSFDNGGACNPPKKGTPSYIILTDKLKAALANYQQFEKDLRGAL